MTIRWFELAKMVTRHHVRRVHGVEAHDPYACEEEACPLCRAHWQDEAMDRAVDERKEKGG